jgi:hypothetical protein
LCCGAGARWQVRPVSPPGSFPSWCGRPATLAVQPPIEALRAIHPHLHGVFAEDLAILRAVSRNPLGGFAASTTPADSPTLPQRGRNQATGRDGFTLNHGESRGERAPNRLIEDWCRRYGPGRDGSEPDRSVERSRRADSRAACRPVVAWLSNDVSACRGLAVAWLKRGANARSWN